MQRITRAWDAFSDDDIGLAVSWARRALATGSDDAKAVVLGGFALVMLRQDYIAGMDALRRAVAMNPGSGFVNAMSGSGLVFGDDIETGLAHLDRAMSLCPNDPSYFSFLTVAATGHLFRGEFDRCLEFGTRSLALNAGWDSTYWVLLTAYAELNRAEDARRAAEGLLRVNPQASVTNYERVLPMRNPDARAMVTRALRAAGIPE